jgi:glucose-6-phosphate isomerase
MTTMSKPLTQQQAWKALADNHRKGIPTIKNLFAGDPGRGESMTAEAEGLFLDYSKNCITSEALKLLLQLAEETNLRKRIDAMFRGEKIRKPCRSSCCIAGTQGCIHHG